MQLRSTQSAQGPRRADTSALAVHRAGKEERMILLDYRDKRPIYEQMVEKLENLITSGGLEALTKMPSVRSLAMELSVNPNTVQRAYAQLEQDGYLYTVSGRGSFVTAPEEWRENKQAKVLREWQTATRQAREAGISRERLFQELGGIYGGNQASGQGSGPWRETAFAGQTGREPDSREAEQAAGRTFND